MRKSVILVFCAAIALSFAFAGTVPVDKQDKGNKRSVSPPLTTHTIYLDRSHFTGGAQLSSSAFPILENTRGDGQAVNYNTGIQIPANATITELTMRAVMGHNYSSDADRLAFEVYRTNTIGEKVLVTQVKANKVIGSALYRTKTRSVSVSAIAAPFTAVIYMPAANVADPDYKVAWVKITYTTP